MSESESVAELGAALAELNTQTIGRALEILPRVGSTNTILSRRAREGGAEGLVLLADEQETGRGRQGRSWASPPGSSVLCSALLRPTWLPPSRAFALTLVAALAGAEGLEQATGLTIGLKWPNDLQVGPRKLGGILVEAECRPSGIAWAVVGCGINVNWDPTTLPELEQRATSVSRELGHACSRGAVARAFLEALDRRYAELRQGAHDQLLRAWRRRLITLGQRVSVVEQGQTITGTALDVEDDGALVIRDDLGFSHRIMSATGLDWLD